MSIPERDMGKLDLDDGWHRFFLLIIPVTIGVVLGLFLGSPAGWWVGAAFFMVPQIILFVHDWRQIGLDEKKAEAERDERLAEARLKGEERTRLKRLG